MTLTNLNKDTSNKEINHQKEHRLKLIAEEVASILLEIKAIALKPKEPFTFASGIKSPIYCDNRLLLSYPEKREQIINFFAEIVELNEIECDVVAGIATAGIAHAAWLADDFNLPMIYVRGEAKEHGKKNQIEGKLEEGQRVLMVEDLISTGGSSLKAVEAVKESGGVVENCIAIFTYEMEKAKIGFDNAKCNVYTLSNFSTLVEVASKLGYIQEDEKSIVLEWNKNPDKWKERFEERFA